MEPKARGLGTERAAHSLGGAGPLAGTGDPGAVPKHYVHAGQLLAARAPAEISTILGTCVAVCLWDEEAGVGGLNHFLLPQLVNGSVASPRFAAYAMHALVVELRRLGGPRLRLRAKVFGGMHARMRCPTVGDLGHANANAAFHLLAEAAIPVVASDVGGERGRKLIFQVPRGDAWVKYL